jgi:hypothetical protein
MPARGACINARSLTFRTIDHADHALSDESSRLSYAAVLFGWLQEMLIGARPAPRADD